jgi:serine/threonine protein kinase
VTDRVVAGRYALVEELGQGGMGTVYRARDTTLGRDVAIKLMSQRFLEQPDAMARFEREARVGARLQHPHVVATYDFGHGAGEAYLVMQLLQGDLYDFSVEHRPLPFSTIQLIGYQVADALCAAHVLEITHRDLKPENLLVERADPIHVRIADFGMAFMEAAGPKEGRLTEQGHFAGTPTYMSPEQVLDAPITPAVDIYALGVILYELVAGKPPFDGPPASLLSAHAYSDPPPLDKLRPDVPRAMVELIARMLAKAPQDRPSPQVVRRRIGIWLGDQLSPEARQRDATPLSDRDERMISQIGERLDITSPTPTGSVPIAVRGELASELAAAFRVAGFDVIRGDAPHVAVFAIAQSDDALAALVAGGRPVIATCPRGSPARLATLVRVGISEVVIEPPSPETVVRKIRRAVAGSAS